MELHSNAPLANATTSAPLGIGATHALQGPTLEEVIEARAYEAFVGRGGAHGHDQDDWTAATWDVIADTLG